MELHPWGRIRWLARDAIQPGANVTLGYVEIDIGSKNPMHLHPNSDEALHLLDGALEHWIGDDVVRLQPGDTIVVPAGVAHCGRNVGSTTARIVVAYPTGRRQIVLLESP